VKVEFLDKKKVLQSLRRAARQLRQSHSLVQQVVLFGSLAKGDYVPGSDADVLVILEGDSRSFMERIPEFRRCFAGLAIDVEVFPYTCDEMVRGQADSTSFLHSVMTGPTEVLA